MTVKRVARLLARRGAAWGLTLLVGCASNPAAPPAPLNAADARFIQAAAQAGLAEMQTAQLAGQRAKSRVVRAYAGRMIRDHSAADDQLMQLANRKGAVMPAKLDATRQAEMDRLSQETGAAFDQRYVASQFQDQVGMLSIFQTEIADGRDAELTAFAARFVPMIQRHLGQAQLLLTPQKLSSRKLPHPHHRIVPRRRRHRRAS